MTHVYEIPKAKKFYRLQITGYFALEKTINCLGKSYYKGINELPKNVYRDRFIA